jgi:FKBP-type peptidyl-prolyl cis-trans isomerase
MTRRILRLIFATLIVTVVGCKATVDGALPSLLDPAKQSYDPSTGVTIASMRRVSKNVYTQDITGGAGRIVNAGDFVSAYHKGRLANGSVFSQLEAPAPAASFLLDTSSGLMEGWVTGVAGMRTGGKRRIVIGPESGFRYESRLSSVEPTFTIPGNSVLVFEIEIVDSQPKP